MTFQEIFNEPGLYRADSFAKGIAFLIKGNQVDGQNELTQVYYESPYKLTYSDLPLKIYKGLLKKDYKLVYNKNELFK
jgi:hypothetical protein